MFRCPICNDLGIAFWAKMRSGTWIPAICSKCGAKSYTKPLFTGLEGALLFIGQLYAGYLAFKYWSLIPFIVLILVWGLLEVLITLFVPLVSYQKDEER